MNHVTFSEAQFPTINSIQNGQLLKHMFPLSDVSTWRTTEQMATSGHVHRTSTIFFFLDEIVPCGLSLEIE